MFFVCEKGLFEDEVIFALRKVFNAIEVEYKVYTSVEKKEVFGFGGLYVVGIERYELCCVDN